MAEMRSIEGGSGLGSGQRLGHYQIEAPIGQGGMASVYRAKHLVLQKDVALKVMNPTKEDDTDAVARFLREAQAAAAVKHPNVVDITDVGVWEGRPYIIMELLEGEDLQAYLDREGVIEAQSAVHLLLPIIAGMAAVHAAGIVHRDLKPGNIFLAKGRDGEIIPKILDFGISRKATGSEDAPISSTPHGELMGTPLYMSPEAVMGTRELTRASDQYSLGVILYECVTGCSPFSQTDGDSLLALLGAIMEGHLTPPRKVRPGLPAELEAIILRAIRRDPAERYASVRELGRALWPLAAPRTQVLWGPIFGAGEASMGRTSLPPSKPAHRLSWAWAVLVVAAGAAVVVRWANEAPPDPPGEATLVSPPSPSPVARDQTPTSSGGVNQASDEVANLPPAPLPAGEAALPGASAAALPRLAESQGGARGIDAAGISARRRAVAEKLAVAKAQSTRAGAAPGTSADFMLSQDARALAPAGGASTPGEATADDGELVVPQERGRRSVGEGAAAQANVGAAAGPANAAPIFD